MIGLALLISACGGNSDNATSTTPEQQTVKPADLNQMNPQPRDKVQQGGKFVWAISGTLPNFNYHQIDGTLRDNADVLQAIMPRVFLADATATPRHNPDYLIAEPTMVTSPKQVVTYKLNPKAIWYDGTPITAADFIAQWKALNGTNKAFQISASNGYDQIESVVQGADKFEVVMTFKQPYADWKAIYNPLYPATTNSDPKVFNSGWKDKFLTSGGPFKFQSFDATAKTYTIVPNEKWWGNKPKIDAIVYRVLDVDAQPGALANGEIDFMDVGPVADYYNKVKVISGIDVRVAGGPNFRHITINGQSAALQDVNVRQAIAMAINREAIAKAMLGPLPVVPTALNNHIFMQNQKGYQDNSGVVAYNPEKAKQMLDAAGWKVEGGKRMKDGKPLSISMVIPAAVAVSRSESELIQNMLAQVNVELKIDTVPSSDFFDKYITPGQFNFTVFSWMGTAFPISSSESIYKKPAGNDIKQNYARIGTDKIDELYRQATSELDPAKAIQIANDIDKLIWEQVHSLPLYQRPEIVAIKAGVANMGAYGFADIIYEDIGWLSGGK